MNYMSSILNGKYLSGRDGQGKGSKGKRVGVMNLYSTQEEVHSGQTPMCTVL